jgi:hypothetical protein
VGTHMERRPARGGLRGMDESGGQELHVNRSLALSAS